MSRPLLTVAGALVALALPTAASAETLRVSVGDDGSPGPVASGAPVVSADGTRVAFTSRARLTPVDPRGLVQLYVRDLATGRTLIASTSAVGLAADADVLEHPSRPPYALSAEGRYVVFASEATSLAPDANGPKRDIFRKDLATGAVAIVSRGTDGAQAAESVLGDPDVSADGRRVAFATGAAQGLYPGDPTSDSDVVVRDVTAGTTTVASVRADGAVAAAADAPSISADGSAVAFVSASDGVAAVDRNGAPDVFVRDLAAGTTTLASVGPDGAPAGGMAPDLSGTGRIVAFETAAALAGPVDANAVADVYLRDLATNGLTATTLVSARDGLLAAGDGASGGATLSADGRRVAFVSEAADLVGQDANGAVADVYLRDPATRATRRASVGASGIQAPAQRAAGPAALSGNGGTAAFGYDDGAPSIGLLPGDANGAPDAFVARVGPTDAAGPEIEIIEPAAGSPAGARRVSVVGRASDPSGVASVLVDGRRARLGADGSFQVATRLSLGPNVIVAVATDGAGNRSRLERPVGRDPAGGPQLPGAGRVSGLVIRLRGARMTAVFQLSDLARVRAELFARLPAAEGRPRAQLSRRARSTLRDLLPGVRGLPIALPRRLPPGRYEVRVSAVSAGGVSAVTAPFTVEGP